MTFQECIALIEAEKELMVGVSTGGPRIQEVNPAYIERRRQIAAFLREAGIEDPNRFTDLWAWHGKWSNGDLPNYKSRRDYLRELFGPTLETLAQRTAGRSAEPAQKPTGWPRVDRDLDAVRTQLERAKSELDFQHVGLACRETLISLGQVVYDPLRHTTSDGIKPSDTDAYRMIEAFFSGELSGGSHEIVRGHAKSACKLAVELQHRRTADRRSAQLCAEATRTVVNLSAIVIGRHS